MGVFAFARYSSAALGYQCDLEPAVKKVLIHCSTMLTTVWLVIIVCAFWIMRYCWKRRRLWYLASKIPGLSGYPIVGSALDLTGTNEKCLKFLRTHLKKYYPTVKIWVGSWLWVAVSDPDDVETVIKSTKCLGRKFLKDVLDHGRAGDGLITLSGDKWTYHRKEIMPTFKLSVLKNYISIFQKYSFELVNKWSSDANGKEMDIFNVICYYNLHMVFSTIMGVDIDSNNKKLNKYLISIHNLKKLIIDFLRNPCPKFHSLLYAKKIKNNTKDFVDFPNFVVSEKISSVKNKMIENRSNKEYESQSGNIKLGYLDHLVESLLSGSSVLSEEEIRGETVSTMFAGFETTAPGSSFALMLLAFHPDIQDRAFQELVDIFGYDKMQPATFEDLKEMTYLEQIINETLRLYPSIPITMRDVEEEIPIKNYIIPADCTIMINFLRNPKYFTDPDKFDPDNFSPEKKSTRHPFVFKPFSDGPRICVGAKYAMLQMKVLLSTILRYYKILPVGKLEDLERLESTISIIPVLGVKLQVKAILNGAILTQTPLVNSDTRARALTSTLQRSTQQTEWIFRLTSCSGLDPRPAGNKE
uniref:(California timema) hypothetical protein n=1 Tax=Timema californicum TaxID=61474 RepID=A0A7R9PB89_TIMCA|nr:unnamed protein product [Timema californicum]